MTTIWKYEIPVSDEFTIDMPAGAEVVHVAVQDGKPYMWVRVNPSGTPQRHTFHVHGTGHAIPSGRIHRGSFLLYDGAFVGHLFEPVSKGRAH